MPVTRWTFYDTTNGDTWTVPVNPNQMAPLFPERPITQQPVVAPGGAPLLFEGNRAATQWSFGGAILDHDHHEQLRSWVYDKTGTVRITDHFGRQIDCVLVRFEATPIKRYGRYWRHDYTISALVLSVGAATVEV